MKNIIIIGSRGYRFNYGGWETFVTEFVDNNHDNNNFFIPRLVQEKELDKKIETINNVEINNIYVPKQGFATMFTFTIKSFNYFLKYIKEKKIKDCIIISLGCKIGPLMPYYYKKLHKMGVRIIMNPDGLEWKRDKWNWLIKQCFKISEKYSIKYSDSVVCDSKAIKKYIDEKYKKYNKPSKFIAYGSYLDNEKVSEKTKQYIKEKYRTKPNDYYLVVARFVPENNLELIINEFIKSKTKKKLIILSNVEKNKYYNYLIEKTGFNNDERIYLPGPIYNQELLREIRLGAFAYIHGHSAGGTNPSLLEALSTTNINILYDVVYNKEVGKNATLYFSKKENSLTKIINNLEKITTKDINKYGKLAKERIEKNYTWEIVEEKYKKLFEELGGPHEET